MDARQTAPLPLLALMAVLAGCEDNGNDAQQNDYLMLQDGNRWVYQWEQEVNGQPEYQLQLVKRTGTGSLASASAYRLRHHTIEGSGISYNMLMRLAESTLFLDAEVHAGNEPYATIGPLPVIRLPLRPTRGYELYDHPNKLGEDLDLDGIADVASLHARVNEVRRENITTTLGTFAALRVETSRTESWVSSKDGVTNTFSATETAWYVDGIGVVKREFSHGRTETLIGYKTASYTTDTTPPQLYGAAGGSAHMASIQFDEQLDPDSVSISLRDSSLLPVAGRTTTDLAPVFTSRIAAFIPDSPLSPGTYTATLNSATDALGNAFPTPYSWSFTVDPPSF